MKKETKQTIWTIIKMIGDAVISAGKVAKQVALVKTLKNKTMMHPDGRPHPQLPGEKSPIKILIDLIFGTKK